MRTDAIHFNLGLLLLNECLPFLISYTLLKKKSHVLVEGNPEEFVGGGSILAELFQTEPVVD